MKPIIDGKDIIAKLGSRELTREELRRLPKGVKDKVKFFPRETTKVDEVQLGKDLDVMVEYGYLEARLDNNLLTKDEYAKLPKEAKSKVTFKNSEKGLEAAKKMNKPTISEWATKEELAVALDTSIDEIDNDLTRHINMGFIEEKDGLYRINDSDGKAVERIKEYMNKIERLKKEEKFGITGAIETMVKGGIYDAIKKGWIEFQDERTYTADEWNALNKIEQESIGIRLTEKGKREIEDDNPLKIYDELAGRKRADGGLNLVADVHEKDGEIHLILTEDGERVKKLGEAMGISPERVFETMLNVGLQKDLNKYMIVGEKQIMEGNRRVS